MITAEFTRLIEAGVDPDDMQKALKRAHYLNDQGITPMTEGHFYHEFDEAIGWSIAERAATYRAATDELAGRAVESLAGDLSSMYRDYLEEDAIRQCGRGGCLAPEGFSIVLDDMIAAIDYRIDHAQITQLRTYAADPLMCRELVVRVVDHELSRVMKANCWTSCPQDGVCTLPIKEAALACLQPAEVSTHDTSAVISLMTTYVGDRAKAQLRRGQDLYKRISSLWRPSKFKLSPNQAETPDQV